MNELIWIVDLEKQVNPFLVRDSETGVVFVTPEPFPQLYPQNLLLEAEREKVEAENIRRNTAVDIMFAEKMNNAAQGLGAVDPCLDCPTRESAEQLDCKSYCSAYHKYFIVSQEPAPKTTGGDYTLADCERIDKGEQTAEEEGLKRLREDMPALYAEYFGEVENGG